MYTANPVFKVISCGGFAILPRVSLHRNEWDHTQANDPSVALDHLIGAIERPRAIYQDHLHEGNLVFARTGKDARSGHPIRVAVKRLPHDSFVATAWYSGRKFRGRLHWQPEDMI